MIDQENFMTYLSNNYEHLYEVEQKIREIREKTGYGNVFIDIRVVNNKPDKITISYSAEKIIKRRKDNVFE